MARKKLDTLTEPMFYVLLSLRQERHGYGVMQDIAQLTQGRVKVGAGTLYALLERFEKDGLIVHTRVEEKRKYYHITAEGERILQAEYERIRRQAADMEAVLRKERAP
ncbi:MAG TPA: PadR family transcriptional regulator [Candidatus Flavonifractor merdigallinarum]|uniref:PadR family transcriptional regulator n=1 Tax=Candidatus Flavonifractor merdigallinarum TaxID=2838589 RepID=A0A9D2BZH5_9FIRM|nr:PadR family transcriptional regulator [Candidatus Flavonifractor merdigallinarum]